MRSKGGVFFVAPSLLGGGAERVAIALSRYCVSCGYEFTFLLTKNKKIDYEIPRGVQVYSEHADSSLGPIEQIKLIRSFMKRNKEAVFISFLPHQNMYMLLASAGLPNKTIISVRNDPAFDFPGSALLPRVRNLIYRMANSIVFQTEHQMRSFPKRISRKGVIILNPLSDGVPGIFNGPRRKVIATSGRLEKQKDHATTIKAFAKFHESHPEYLLEIYGEGSLKDELKSLAVSLGVGKSVIFAGFDPSALEKIRTASAFVMSSRYEGISNAMLESLCMGVPTVCTRCLGGGAEAVVTDKVNGRLVDIGDVAEEAAALEEMVDNPNVARGYSLAALGLRESLSIDGIGSKWLRLF